MASRSIFVNIPVNDLKKSMEFFSKLGFEFNPQFTDENAACMILGKEGYVMLLKTPFFKTFTTREIGDPHKATTAIFALSCESRGEVDELLKKALAAGGKEAMPKKNIGFMVNTSFYDLDGHHWEVMYMDPAHVK
jgi:uncharacterized protein